MYEDFRDDPNHPMKSIPQHTTTQGLPKKQKYKRRPKPTATNHKQGGGHGIDLLIQQVIDEDCTQKCAPKNNKQGIKHKVQQKGNLTAHAGHSHTRDDQGRNPDRGTHHDRGENQSKTGTIKVEHAIWLQLTPDVQNIITNSNVHLSKANYGVIHVPYELWSHLPPEAQSAIGRHNNSLSPSFGAYMQNPLRNTPPARYMHQMNRLAQQVQPSKAEVKGPAHPS
jgi:hypothetical protein